LRTETKVNVKVKSRQGYTLKEANVGMVKTEVLPEDFDDIQTQTDQVWNCDEVGIDPNGNWHRIVCTYKWCNVTKIWKTQEGEHAPLWFTIYFLVEQMVNHSLLPPLSVKPPNGLNFSVLTFLGTGQ